MDIITVYQVSKYFKHNQKKTVVIDQANFTLAQHRSYAITGSSGSGKSTLLHMIAHLLHPDSGSLRFNNKEYHSYTKQEKEIFLRDTVGIVFQQPYVIPELSVLENVTLPGRIKGEHASMLFKKGMQLLDEVGLASYANEPIKSLSTGQQQRVAVARAVYNKPAFLLADEPTSALDAITATQVITLIMHFHRTYNMGLILCTHDKKIVELLDHRIVIKEKRVTLI